MPNAMRWDGRAPRFYEVWYFIVQRPETQEAFWIRYTLLNPLDVHPAAGAGLWFAYARRGHAEAGFAVHENHPRSALRATPGAFDLAIADATLREGALRGALEAGGHSVSWDLTYTRDGEVHYYFAPWLRRVMEKKTSVTLPNPRATFRGRVVVDGREITLDGAPGHQAHHWGREKATSWIWAHCAAFRDAPGGLFEALSAEKPPLPTMTFVRALADGLACEHTGVLRAIRNRSEAARGVWRFTSGDRESRVEAELTADPASVLRFQYHSPRYEVSYCYNSPVADARVRVYRRIAGGGWDLARELHAEGTANAEVVLPASVPGPYA